MVPEKLFCGRPTCNTVGAGNKYNKYTFQKQQWAIFAKNCYSLNAVRDCVDSLLNAEYIVLDSAEFKLSAVRDSAEPIQ